jgi:hypothetical protein
MSNGDFGGDWKVFPSANGAAMDFDKKAKEPVSAAAEDPFQDPIQPVREAPLSGQMTGVVPPEYGKEHEESRTDHIERVETNLGDPKTRNTKQQRLKRHCMRYWICYVLGNIIFLAILLPIM